MNIKTPRPSLLATAISQMLMMGHDVLVYGIPKSFAELYMTPEGQRFLSELRGCEKGKILCTCNSNVVLPLLVQERHGKFFLRSYPETKPDHHETCARHGETSRTSAGPVDSARCVIEVNGETHVELNVSLSADVVPAIDYPAPLAIEGVTKTTDRPSRSGKANTAGLLLGLRAFWSTAGLHGTIRHRNTPDSWGDLTKRISKEFPTVRFSGELASDVMVVAGTQRTIQHDRLQQDSLGGGKKYCLLIGEVSRFKTEVENPAMATLRFSNCETPIQIEADTWEDAVRWCPFPNAEAIVASMHLPRQMLTFVAMGRIERTDKGQIRLVDLRLMVVSRFYIPVESRLEAEMANELVRAGRRFLKPLLYNAQVDIVLPDFVLYDTALPCLIEVFGVQGNADYDAGASCKRVLYIFNSDQILFAEWLGKESLPSLPEGQHRTWLSLPTGIRTGLRLRKVPEPMED